jgi:hypothetical protein
MKITPTQMTLLTSESFEVINREQAGVLEQQPAEIKVLFLVYGKWTGSIEALNKLIFEALNNIPEIKEP